jgi:hypothetical protein
MQQYTGKRCSKCETFKSLEEFHLNSSQPDGRRSDCKLCRKAFDAARYKTSRRKELLVERYGIGDEEYYSLLEKQSGVCALCSADTPGGRWKKFNVDHCHDTGRVRGLLCYRCNTALGQLGDNEVGLMKALSYVTN